MEQRTEYKSGKGVSGPRFVLLQPARGTISVIFSFVDEEMILEELEGWILTSDQKVQNSSNHK